MSDEEKIIELRLSIKREIEAINNCMTSWKGMTNGLNSMKKELLRLQLIKIKKLNDGSKKS